MTSTTNPPRNSTSPTDRTERVILAVGWALVVLTVLVAVYCIAALAGSAPVPAGTPPLPAAP